MPAHNFDADLPTLLRTLLERIERLESGQIDDVNEIALLKARITALEQEQG